MKSQENNVKYNLARNHTAGQALGVVGAFLGFFGTFALPVALFVGGPFSIAVFVTLAVSFLSLLTWLGMPYGELWALWLGRGLSAVMSLGLPVLFWWDPPTDPWAWIWFGLIWFYFVCVGAALIGRPLNSSSPTSLDSKPSDVT